MEQEKMSIELNKALVVLESVEGCRLALESAISYTLKHKTFSKGSKEPFYLEVLADVFGVKL